MQACGDDHEVVALYDKDSIPDLAAYDLLLVLGGPMDVWETEAHPWLIAEKAAIRHWVGVLDRPYLGLCLGHQLLVEAMGGTCGAMSVPEIAVTEVSLTAEAANDALFAGLPDPLPCVQWHGVEATRLPENCSLLAQNAACKHQAIRVGTQAWGVQFHPELTAGTVAGWLQDEDTFGAAIRWLGSEHKARNLVAAGDAVADDLLQISAEIWTRFRGLPDHLSR